MKKVFKIKAKDSILQEYEQIRREIGEKKYNAIQKYLATHKNILLSDIYYNEGEWNKFEQWFNNGMKDSKVKDGKYVVNNMNDLKRLFSNFPKGDVEISYGRSGFYYNIRPQANGKVSLGSAGYDGTFNNLREALEWVVYDFRDLILNVNPDGSDRDCAVKDYKSDELNKILKEKFQKVGKQKIEEYAKKLKAEGKYQVFGTRLIWDLIRATTRVGEVSEWYDKYDVNDDHITSSGRKALKEIGISIQDGGITERLEEATDIIKENLEDAVSEPNIPAKGKWEWDEVKYDWYDTGRGAYYEEILKQHKVGDAMPEAEALAQIIKADKRFSDPRTQIKYVGKAKTTTGKEMDKYVVGIKGGPIQYNAYFWETGKLNYISSAPAGTRNDKAVKDETFKVGSRVRHLAQETNGTVKKLMGNNIYVEWDEPIYDMRGGSISASEIDPSVTKIKKLSDKKVKDAPNIPTQNISELKKYAERYNYEWEEVIDGYISRIRRHGMQPEQAVEDLKETMASMTSLYDTKDIDNIYESLKKSYKKGELTIKQVAEELFKAGHSNYVDINLAKKVVADGKSSKVKDGEIWEFVVTSDKYGDEKIVAKSDKLAKAKYQENHPDLTTMQIRIKTFSLYSRDSKTKDADPTYKSVWLKVKGYVLNHYNFNYKKDFKGLMDFLNSTYGGSIDEGAVYDILRDLNSKGYIVFVKDSKLKDAHIYLFAKSDMTSKDIQEARKYNLEVLGTNRFNGEVNLVVKGDLNNLKSFAKNYLDYELHPSYLYKEHEFAGKITKDSKISDAEDFIKYFTNKTFPSAGDFLDYVKYTYGDYKWSNNSDGSMNVIVNGERYRVKFDYSYTRKPSDKCQIKSITKDSKISDKKIFKTQKEFEEYVVKNYGKGEVHQNESDVTGDSYIYVTPKKAIYYKLNQNGTIETDLTDSVKDAWSGIRQNGVTYYFSNGEYTITHNNGKVEKFPESKFKTAEELYAYVDSIKDSKFNDERRKMLSGWCNTSEKIKRGKALIKELGLNLTVDVGLDETYVEGSSNDIEKLFTEYHKRYKDSKMKDTHNYNIKPRQQITVANAYDNAEYYWAKFEYDMPNGQLWKIINLQHTVEKKITAKNENEVIAELEKYNSKITPRIARDSKMKDYQSYVGFAGAEKLKQDIKNYNGNPEVFSYFLKPKQASSIELMGAIINKKEFFLTMIMRTATYKGDLAGAKKDALKAVEDVVRTWKQLSYEDSAIKDAKKLWEVMSRYGVKQYSADNEMDAVKLYMKDYPKATEDDITIRLIKQISSSNHSALLASENIDSSIGSNSYSAIRKEIENTPTGDNFDAVLSGGKFIRWVAKYENGGIVYTAWSSRNPEKKEFKNFAEVQKYAIALLDNMKQYLKDRAVKDGTQDLNYLKLLIDKAKGEKDTKVLKDIVTKWNETIRKMYNAKELGYALPIDALKLPVSEGTIQLPSMFDYKDVENEYIRTMKSKDSRTYRVTHKDKTYKVKATSKKDAALIVANRVK